MSHKPRNQWNKKITERYSKQKNEKYRELSKENKSTFLGNKTKRNIEDIYTNDTSIKNRPTSETETYIENEKKNRISLESSSSKYDKKSKEANKNKTKIKKGQRLSQFNPKNKSNFDPKGKSQNNEENEENDEDSSSKDKQIDLNEEESDIKEKKLQYYHNKKKKHIKENQDSNSETNEIKENISSDDEESFEIKNINNRNENANYPIVKKNDNPNPNVVTREEFNALKENFETFKRKMVKLIGVQGEINYQNEKYIQNNLCVKIGNLEYKYKILINSYRVLFIRKLANIFLDEIYERYREHFKTFEFKYKKQKHKISACISNIKGIGCGNINLIVDFLKHIKIRASDIIHMQDKEIKFKKEILFDYLNRELENNTINRDNFLTLNDAISLVFRSRKKKEMLKKENHHYENMKKIFEKEKEDNNNPEKGKLRKEIKIKKKYKTDNYDEGDEEEEERIRKILSGDENLIETNLSSQLDLLLKKIELNREIVNPEEKIEELKKITPEFFFDSWKNSFIKEKFKCHHTYRYYVNPDNITSVKNLGRYLRELLEGMTINLENNDPSKLDTKIEQE